MGGGLAELKIKASIPLFDRTDPSLRPDLPSGRAPRAAVVKTGRRPPPEAARRGLDGGEHGARLNRSGLGRTSQCFLFVFAQIIHVEVAMLLEPILMRLDGERPH